MNEFDKNIKVSLDGDAVGQGILFENRQVGEELRLENCQKDPFSPFEFEFLEQLLGRLEADYQM